LPQKKTEEGSFFGGLWELAVSAFRNFGSIEDRVEKTLKKHKGAFQWWMVKTFVMGLSVFMSLSLLTLGLLFIAMDYGGIPRGVVFTCGGLLGLLIFGLWFYQQNKNRENRNE